MISCLKSSPRWTSAFLRARARSTKRLTAPKLLRRFQKDLETLPVKALSFNAWAVACSGGGDSLAVTLALAELAQRNKIIFYALIVDHGIDASLAGAARKTQAQLAACGIIAPILAVCGTPPKTGIEEWARNQRYRLLQEFCRTWHIRALFTGHHRQDQLETQLMRSLSGSHRRGLAGMARWEYRHDLVLLRPALSFAREELAELPKLLQPAPIKAVNDPANKDQRFLRARMRSGDLKEATEKEATKQESIAEQGAGRLSLEIRVARFLAERMQVKQDAVFIRLKLRAEWQAEEFLYALGDLLAALGGRDFPPKRLQLARLIEMIDRLFAAKSSRRGEVRFRYQLSNVDVLVTRDSSALLMRLRPIKPTGQNLVPNWRVGRFFGQ